MTQSTERKANGCTHWNDQWAHLSSVNKHENPYVDTIFLEKSSRREKVSSRIKEYFEVKNILEGYRRS